VDAGASFTLPSASAPSGYTFIGWVADNYDYAGSRPSSVLTGSYTPAGSITLSALYSHTSNAKVYELVTAAPADWSGNYVVTYGKDGNMYAMKGLSGTTKYESVSAGGAKDLASAGMTLSGSVLSNAQSDYVFTMEASGSGYTLKNSAAGTYLVSRIGCLYSSPAFSSASCLWTPSMNGEAVNLRNNAGGKYPFLSFSSLGHFIVNGSSGNCIYLWKEASGSTATLYTTVIH
jgi:WD40 repeat protein